MKQVFFEHKIVLANSELANEYMKLKSQITTQSDWYGHSYADLIGIVYENGIKKSAFKKDQKSGNFEILDSFIATGKLMEDIRYKKDGTSYTNYYVLYNVENHSSTKPTVVDADLNNQACNIRREYTYEILLGFEGKKRYLTNTCRSTGPGGLSLPDTISQLEDFFEMLFEDKDKGFRSEKDFCDDYSEIFYVDFYDDTGEEFSLWFDSIQEILDCVRSIRIIDIKTAII